MQNIVSKWFFVPAISALLLLACLMLNISGNLPYAITAIMFMLLIYVAIIVFLFKQRPENKRTVFIIFFLVLVILGIFGTNEARYANDISRLATMYSLVHNDTFETGNFNSIDKIYINGKYYSDKPVMLSFLGSGIYAILHKILGYFGKEINHPNEVYFLIILFLIIIPVALSSAVFYLLLGFLNVKETYRLLLAFAFIFATLMFSYGTFLNNHAITGAVLLIAFYFLLRNLSQKSPKDAAISGFLFALAGTFELPSIVWLALFGLLLLIKRQKDSLKWYILGAALPLIFHAVLTYQVSGKFVHSYSKEAFRWPYSPWVAKHPDDPWHRYLWNITIGHHGMFMYTPLFLFSILGLILELKNYKNKFWLEVLLCMAGLIILFAFYDIQIQHYGGSAFGFRSLISITPFMMFLISLIFSQHHKEFLSKHKWLLIIFWILLGYSFWVACIATGFVWKTHPPPIYILNSFL